MENFLPSRSVMIDGTEQPFFARDAPAVPIKSPSI